jgi:tetratricopeptide (TPR) repeat protein
MQTDRSGGSMGLDICEQVVEQVVRPGANGPEFHNDRGAARYARGDIEGALAEDDRALELDPQYAEAYKNRGTARHARGDIDQALADFDRALELNPRYAEAYTNRGMVRYGRGDLEGAIEDFDRALEFTPGRGAAPIHDNRGAARHGDFDGAIADFSRALEIDPGDCVAYISRGDVRYHKGDSGSEAENRTAFLLDARLAAHEMVRRLEVDIWDSVASVLMNCRRRLDIDSQDLVDRTRLGLTLLMLHQDDEGLCELQQVFRQGAPWRPFLRLLINAAKEQRARLFAWAFPGL